jgi:hypothetical protein
MITIRAYREQSIRRPGQVEKVLCKFGIGPKRHHVTFADPEMKAKVEAHIENTEPVLTGFVLTAEQARECKPGVVYRDTTEWPEHYSSTVNLVEQGDDGGQIELEISLDDAAADKAPALIAERGRRHNGRRISARPKQKTRSQDKTRRAHIACGKEGACVR